MAVAVGIETPTDRSVCKILDLAQCSVAIVGEVAKQRLRVKEESYNAYIVAELSDSIHFDRQDVTMVNKKTYFDVTMTTLGRVTRKYER